MIIREMSRKECRDLPAQLSFGRLGCAYRNQPYVVPIYSILRMAFLLARILRRIRHRLQETVVQAPVGPPRQRLDGFVQMCFRSAP
jgi:hypothetical protein